MTRCLNNTAKLVVIAGFASALLAASVSAQKAPPGKATAPPAAAQTGSIAPGLPSPETLIVLLRGTLIALDQANQTGNYTVLRDLAAPGFQAANTASRLSDIFRNYREQRIDIGAVALATPQLVAGPVVDQNGMIRMAGFFPMQPFQINFDVTYQQVNGRWRPFGLSANPVVAAAQAAPAPVQAARKAN
jgi:hypothetical protein